ncbi:MAG: hypothetical protein ACN0LA_06400 [Candidatus Longimicrobiales bacterium M2_2A_002]
MRLKRLMRLAPLVLGVLLVASCDEPLEPFQENTIGPYSVYGYLDLSADTQWIRVTPIRQDIRPDSTAIDAAVTLEEVGSGRVLTLQDSLFRFVDRGVGGAGYAHNFWTTEPLGPDATYRLRVERSDGAATTAVVEMPAEPRVTLRFFENPETPGLRLPRQLVVQTENVLYTYLAYTVWNENTQRGVDPVVLRWPPTSFGSGLWRFTFPGIGPLDRLDMPPYIDMLRREARLATAGSDWPYDADLSDSDLSIPGLVPTTVENGVGQVRGVSTWRIPLVFCEILEPTPDGRGCTLELHRPSATVVGTVVDDPCAGPRHLPAVRLTQQFPVGGAVAWNWTADWDGSYRFIGIEPGADLLLEFEDAGTTIPIPPLEPGERYVAPEVVVPSTCQS